MLDKKSKVIFCFLILTILISFMIIYRHNYGINNKKTIKFAYIPKSQTGKSYNDIYNEEFIRYFSRSTNTNVDIVKGTYEELKKINDIDVFIDLPSKRVDLKQIELPNRLKYKIYAKEYLSFEDFFSGKKIAFFNHEDRFFNHFTSIHNTNYYVAVNNIEEGFQLLNEGKVDAFFTVEDSIYMRNPIRKHIVSIESNKDTSFNKSLQIFNKDIGFYMEKFINHLTPKEKMDLEDATEAKLIWSQINLSKEEVDFLKNKQIIKVGGNFDRLAPLAYYEERQLRGSIYEYFDIFQKGTGVQVEYVKKTSDSSLIRSLKNKSIDVDAGFFSGRNLEGTVETTPYFQSQVGIFSLVGRKGENLDSVINGLKKNMGATGIKMDPLSINHEFKPNLKTDKLYNMLKNEEIDYFTHSYSILKHPYNLQGIEDLRLYRVSDKRISFSMAAMEENQIIIDIIDQLFSYLDHDDIRYKWEMISSSLERKNNYKKFVVIFGIALFFLLPYIFILKVEMGKIKKIEIELQDTKKNLENALNIKSAFLANMSHEMRTPLTAILGFNKLLLRKEEESKKKELLRNVGVAANNLLEFINNVLDLSKLESGKIELRNKRINLVQMADDLEKISLGLKRSDEVVFKLIIKEDAPKYFMGDEVWLKEIILNLLGNAFKFTEKGSVSLSLKRRDENLIIQVRDTGIGMKKIEDEEEKIFKRYEQLDLNENRDKKGSGLGLAIVKEVVELMDGEICVKSLYKVGTTFSITLPIKKTLDVQDIRVSNLNKEFK